MLTLIISTFGSAGLIAAALWLARKLISERLTQSIRLETEKKLAKFQADLSATHKAISELTSFSHSASQQVDLSVLPFRVEAIKTLMAAASEWQKVYAATSMIHVFDADFLRESRGQESAKQLIEQLLVGIKIPEFLSSQNKALLAQPFVSESAWVLYYAYHSYYSSMLVKSNLITISGIDHAEVLTRVNETDLVRKSAPTEIFELYHKNPYTGAPTYLKYLHDEMIREFRESLSGKRASDESLRRNAEIIQAATKLVVEGSNEALMAQSGIDSRSA